MDTLLLKILEKEKSKKKKRSIFKLKKEKSIMYYSGWHKGNPIKEKRQKNKRN